jgi:ABC-2 type transport system permease protein
VGLAVTVVTLFFTHLPVEHLLLIFVAVFLTAMIFSLAGLINGVFAKNFDQVNWIPTFILTPLTYFGGVFYSINLLPEWARTLSFANPILHMVNAFRYGFLGRSDVDVFAALAIMSLSVVVLFFIALRLMSRSAGLRD